jgi:hypothetical protein
MDGYVQPVTRIANTAKAGSKLPKRFSKRTKPLLFRRDMLVRPLDDILLAAITLFRLKYHLVQVNETLASRAVRK